MKETIFYIKDMDCEDEATCVRNSLERLEGIMNYEINIMGQTLKVTYDPSLVSSREIVSAIEKAGLKATVKRQGPKEILEMAPVWWREPRILTLSICAFFIALSLTGEHVFGIPHRVANTLYAIAVVVGGYWPARMGLLALWRLRPNIRTLMVVGALGAIALGLWEEASLLILIYSLGDVLEAYATDRVRKAVQTLMMLAPKKALVRRDGQEQTLPLDDIRIGDIVIIRPGERIPLDGKVIDGTSSVDQSPITGESIPVAKAPGDEVFAGSINQRGALEVVVTKPFHDTTLGRIIHYVEEAESRRSSYQRFGETFGRYYTPTMFGLAALVMAVPPLITGNFVEWFYRGLVVLVVSCSCGIALSIPVSIVASIANAARHGILIKGGAYLEASDRIKAIAFDKTGSLTRGKATVTDIITFTGISTEELLTIAASIERRSEHILAEAILKKAENLGIVPYDDIEEFETMPGFGVRARINGQQYTIGSKELLKRAPLSEPHLQRIKELESEGKTLVFLLAGNLPLGLIAVKDELREEAKRAIEQLKALGIKDLYILTGDNSAVAEVIAKETGITQYRAELMPEEKAEIIKTLRKEHGHIAMVGDGVNDAPAMVVSDLAIAMGAAGTDVAIETGDIVLMSDNLLRIPYVVELGKNAVRNIKENITLSLTVIAVLIPLALTGNIGLVPGLLINELGGLLVILNGLRLLRYKPRTKRSYL